MKCKNCKNTSKTFVQYEKTYTHKEKKRKKKQNTAEMSITLCLPMTLPGGGGDELF